jgi:hypothetical protein
MPEKGSKTVDAFLCLKERFSPWSPDMRQEHFFSRKGSASNNAGLAA